jgi:hypothetical protein
MARSAVTHYGGNKCIWRFRMKIDSALKGANALSSNPPGFIRSLGAFEEIYWLFSQTGPKGFAYAAEIEGAHHSRRMSKKMLLMLFRRDSGNDGPWRILRHPGPRRWRPNNFEIGKVFQFDFRRPSCTGRTTSKSLTVLRKKPPLSRRPAQTVCPG